MNIICACNILSCSEYKKRPPLQNFVQVSCRSMAAMSQKGIGSTPVDETLK